LSYEAYEALVSFKWPVFLSTDSEEEKKIELTFSAKQKDPFEILRSLAERFGGKVLSYTSGPKAYMILTGGKELIFLLAGSVEEARALVWQRGIGVLNHYRVRILWINGKKLSLPPVAKLPRQTIIQGMTRTIPRKKRWQKPRRRI